jgi:hypothetical protein
MTILSLALLGVLIILNGELALPGKLAPLAT